jgi:hypothetical protein
MVRIIAIKERREENIGTAILKFGIGREGRVKTNNPSVKSAPGAVLRFLRPDRAAASRLNHRSPALTTISRLPLSVFGRNGH